MTAIAPLSVLLLALLGVLTMIAAVARIVVAEWRLHGVVVESATPLVPPAAVSTPGLAA